MSSVVISSWKVIIRLGTKSDLLGCLDSCTDNEVGSARPDTDVTILDGAVLVNILKPLAAKTFDEYALKVFLPYIQSALQRASRVDIYHENSLKSQAREKCGKGVRRVDAYTNIPEIGNNFCGSMQTRLSCFPSWPNMWSICQQTRS